MIRRPARSLANRRSGRRKPVRPELTQLAVSGSNLRRLVGGALASGDVAAAQAILDRNKDRHWQSTTLHSLQASVLEFKGDAAGAEQVLLRTVRMFPRRLAPRQELLEFYVDKREWHGFQRAARRARADLRGQASETWLSLKEAQLLLLLGRPEAGLRVLAQRLHAQSRDRAVRDAAMELEARARAERASTRRMGISDSQGSTRRYKR